MVWEIGTVCMVKHLPGKWSERQTLGVKGPQSLADAIGTCLAIPLVHDHKAQVPSPSLSMPTTPWTVGRGIITHYTGKQNISTYFLMQQNRKCIRSKVFALIPKLKFGLKVFLMKF
eukprot:3859067-Amphidinium_carterae.2